MINLSPIALLCLLLLLLGCGPAEDLEIRVEAMIVSSRPDVVTGGDMLVSGLDRNIGLEVNGKRVSVTWQGPLAFVEGLPLGAHELVGHLDAREVLRLPFTNHPAQGPVISGPHQAPFFCETDAFEVTPGGETLAAAEPPLCVVPRRSDPVSLGDIEATVETGVINHAIYQIAVPVGWNGKLVYRFGGGCRGGWYRQGARTGGVFEPHLLGEGYAVASASLNVFGVNCNDLLAAETMMMVKERFIEANGVPRLTIGLGCSGGSYQGHQIADNYPGLLDGILVGCSFPEVGHAMVTSLADTRLLKRYFDWANRETSVSWSTADKLAVTGLPSEASIDSLAAGAARITAGLD